MANSSPASSIAGSDIGKKASLAELVFWSTSIRGKGATSMRCTYQERIRQQASFPRRQFLRDGDLPFTDVLTERVIARALTAINVYWLDRIFSPLVTHWVFLGGVLRQTVPNLKALKVESIVRCSTIHPKKNSISVQR
jgi:hypothetical protein